MQKVLNFFGGVGAFLLVIAILAGVLVGGSWGSFKMYQWLGGQYEDARTDIYRKSKSYEEGTIRDLRRLKREYETADEEAKSTLVTIIRQRSDEIDYSDLPGDLRRFLEDL